MYKRSVVVQKTAALLPQVEKMERRTGDRINISRHQELSPEWSISVEKPQGNYHYFKYIDEDDILSNGYLCHLGSGLLAFTNSRDLLLINLIDRQEERFPLFIDINSLSPHPFKEQLLISNDSMAGIFCMQTKRLSAIWSRGTLSGSTQTVFMPSAPEKVVFAISRDHPFVWDIEKGAYAFKFPDAFNYCHVNCSSEGLVSLAATTSGIWLYDVRQRKACGNLRKDGDENYKSQFCDQYRLASDTYPPGIYIWDLRKQEVESYLWTQDYLTRLDYNVQTNRLLVIDCNIVMVCSPRLRTTELYPTYFRYQSGCFALEGHKIFLLKKFLRSACIEIDIQKRMNSYSPF